MKKNALFVLILFVLTLFGVRLGETTAFADAPSDSGGDGFLYGDPCGYVMGRAELFTATEGEAYTQIDFSSMDDDEQGCIQNNGNFTASKAEYNVYQLPGGPEDGAPMESYTIDFVDTENPDNPRYQTQVNPFDGKWSGYARLTNATTGYEGWIWFDWNCYYAGAGLKEEGDIFGPDDIASSDEWLACERGAFGTYDDIAKYQVRTDVNTGEVGGYAWNDQLGFIDFWGLQQEIAHPLVDMWVDVVGSDGASVPQGVSYVDAPLADGSDFWRVRVFFTYTQSYLGPWLSDEGEYAVPASKIASLSITPHRSSDTRIYLNQVEDTGDAIRESDTTTLAAFSDCTGTGACMHTEDLTEPRYDISIPGTTSWSKFITSAAPTSAMLGENEDSDSGIEYFNDRAGCRWIYKDQWMEVTPRGSQPSCAGKKDSKADVFYERSRELNQYILDSVDIDVTFTDPETVVNTYSGLEKQDEDTYRYTPEGGVGLELNFRPRFQSTDFSAFYQDESHEEISLETGIPMKLQSRASVAATSQAFQDAFVVPYPQFVVNTQMDAKSLGGSGSGSDQYLLMDTGGPAAPDCGHRQDSVGVGARTYTADYALGYGVKDVACSGSAATGTPSNTLSEPTAEQWVCDRVNGGTSPVDSCYYTAYLPHQDRHADPENMVVLGAINSLFNSGSFFSNDGTLSVLGSTDTIKLRNTMYAQVVRYTLGQKASSGSLAASTMQPSSGLASLLGGRLVYAEGDVTVNGSSGFMSKTLVAVGGNVIIKGNITGGRLGVIAFKDEEGNGGNVYIAPNVTDLYMNVFADGSVLSYDGVSVPDTPAEFVWDDDETRLSTLLNQLYLNGSLVARNTVNGAPEGAASSWPLGDGTTTTLYGKAREHDLNKLRQYRRCYPLTAEGTVDTSGDLTDCGEGAVLSTKAPSEFADAGSYPSFILEYAPADELPIFRAQSGLFQ